MQFEVRALRDNSVTSVLVDALSVADALAQVAAQSLLPLSARATGALASRRLASSGARLSLTLFSQELLALLEGGLTIVEAIDVLHEKESRPTVKGLYGLIARGLTEGKSFSACLTELP
ncbi:MAG: type II secretion system F family protein, partial [Burkholderiales bacterium]